MQKNYKNLDYGKKKKYTNLFQRPFMNRNKHQVKMAKKSIS